MKRRIIAAAVSILLAASLVLSLPVTVSAETWQETADSYDALFEITDELPENKYNRLFSALFGDPETFLNQLAFRDKKTKEYVQSILTGEWVTDEQLQILSSLVQNIQARPFLTTTEKELLENLQYHLDYAYYSRPHKHRDRNTLFAESLNVHPDNIVSFGLEMKSAFIEDPQNFICALAQEELAVQNNAASYLLENFVDPTPALVVLDLLLQEQTNAVDLPGYYSDPEMALLSRILESTLLMPDPHSFSDPRPHDFMQWLAQAKPSDGYDYDALLSNVNADVAIKLRNALLCDVANFVNELAFRDAETKNQVISAFAGANFSDIYLIQMRYNLVSYHQSFSLTKSETDLLETMIFSLESLYLSRPHAHRDCETLFAEATIHISAEHREKLVFEIINAFLDSPKDFIVHLAKETDAVQKAVISYLIVSEHKSAKLQAVAIQIQRECNRSPDYYTEEEAQLLAEMKHQLPAVIYGPSFIDPDPEEYQQWLEDKGLLGDDPGMTLPIYPHPTQPEPTETTAVEETHPTAGEDPEKNIGWVSTVCFTLGFLCTGIGAGSMIAKKKRSKKAAQAEKQTAAEVPVKIYPKLLYCPAPLSRETQKQISQVLREKYDEYSVHWYSIKQPDGTCRCYGTEGGYDILFYAGGLRMEIPDSCTVGECTFLFETSFELYAHKDGKLTDLNAALEQGLVSHQAVQEALDKHNSISR